MTTTSDKCVFTIDDKWCTCRVGQSLMELADYLSVKIPSSCDNKGTCKECLLEVVVGQEYLSTPTEAEAHLTSRFRLACQAKISGESIIKTKTLKRTLIKIEEEGNGINGITTFDPCVIREGNNVVRRGEVIDVFRGEILGVAVDIGTTTVVVKIIDLQSSRIIATASYENPQRFAGSNIMSRILYDTRQGKKELKRVFLAHLSNTILSICEQPNMIYDVVVGGNSTMRDIFFGIDVESLGQSPYLSQTEIKQKKGLTTTTSISARAKKLHLSVFPEAEVYGLPIIGGHVGADTTACILATDLMSQEELVVILDIGTNTEIVIGHKNRVLATSSPSGPAFEGGGLKCGMPALPGAIERVRIINGKPEITTLANEKAIGICGSGLIDILSELRKHDIINEMGRFEEEIMQYDLTEDKSVYVDENDINLLVQTIGANSAAFNILLDIFGVCQKDISKIYLAGGFGKNMDIDAGINIGLLPDIPHSKYVKVGNAAIVGLQEALLSNKLRMEVEDFVTKIEHVNLESHQRFFDYFVEGCSLSKMTSQ